MSEAHIRAVVRDELARLFAPLAPAQSVSNEPLIIKNDRPAAQALGIGVTLLKTLKENGDLVEGVHFWQYNSEDARVPRWEYNITQIQTDMRSRGKI